MSGVKFTKETVTLPTTVMGPMNPNPMFESNPVSAPYPYPYIYLHENRRYEDRDHLLLTMENEFLQVSVLPLLGSRIHRIHDKITGQELIHHADKISVSYLPGTSGGSYAGVGMELSVPDHHSLTNVRPREWRVSENPDGGVTIIVGELELRYMMRWEIHLTLRPGESALRQKVIIHNQSEKNGRFRFWSNPGIPIDGREIEIFFPEKRGWEHGGGFQEISWPLWDGVDMRLHKNILSTMGIEGKDVENGFFAYYDRNGDFGMVHWADPADVKGKKLWAWPLENRQHAFRLGCGSGFMELQSGRDEDQESFEILAPFQTVSWEENWFGIGALGTVSNASENLAAAVFPDGDSVTVRLQAAAPLDNIELSAANDSRRESVKLSVRPGKVNEIRLKISGVKTVTVTDSGLTLLSHRIEKEENSDLYIEKIANDWPVSEDRCADAIMKEIRCAMRRFPRRKFNSCLPLIEEILKKDPKHAEALKLKGVSLYERALYREAAEVLNLSRDRNPFDPESHYYTGLAMLRTGDLLKSGLAFGLAVKYGLPGAAWFWRGVIASKHGDRQRAAEFFKNAADCNGRHIRAGVYLALTLDLNGARAAAEARLAETAKQLALDPLVTAAAHWLKKHDMSGFGKSPEGKRLAEQLHGDIQTWCQLALDFSLIGLDSAAAALTDTVMSACGESDGSGMLPYYLYYFKSRAGEKAAPPSGLKDESVLYTFPFRHEELDILDFALSGNPDDKFALYYKGLVMAGLTRYDEALTLLGKALERGLRHPVLRIAMGLIARDTMRDPKLAQSHFSAALELEPDNIFALNLAAETLLQLKDFPALEAVLSHPKSETNPDLFLRRVTHLNKSNLLDEGIALYERVDFSGMAQGLTPQWFNLLEKRGIERMKNGDYDGALEDFRRAKIPPENMGAPFYGKRLNMRAEYFIGKALSLQGKHAEAEEVWTAALDQSEQRQDWTLSGAWNYGFWADRFFQGWMLRELGRQTEAAVYFDAVRAAAAHKIKDQFGPAQRRNLMEMAYNGMTGSEILTEQVDQSYLSRE